MRLASLALLVLSLSTVATAQNTVPWGYQGKYGPLVWGKLSPAYAACAKGHEQSPVDLGSAHLDSALQPLQFHYIAGPVKLVNDGGTIVVHVDPGSYMVADGVRYELAELQFRHPSEHAVKGRLANMEVDFVHRSDEGKVAILGVLLSEIRDFPNPTVATLWQHLPEIPGASTPIADMIDPAGLFPPDRGYWTYTGSLTWPPCTEGVRWFVFQQEVSISRSQLDTFTRIFRMNTRPLQSLHGRRIEASE
jgi:carbonic anhydrase